MDAARFDDLRGRLLALLIVLGDRLDLAYQENVEEFLDHAELALALEFMADGLSETGAPITEDERHRMLGLVTEMQMTDRVRRALAFCPKRDDEQGARWET